MPTKRNYGGEQQNYVPKGNEAGGQWGDGETLEKNIKKGLK